MKKASIFAGLFISAVLGLENLVLSIVYVAQGAILDLSETETTTYIRLILSILLLIAAIPGIILMFGPLKKDKGNDSFVPAILLAICAAIFLFGITCVEIVECSKGISIYSKELQNNLLDDDSKDVAQYFIFSNSLYMASRIIEGLLIAGISVFSLITHEKKERA